MKLILKSLGVLVGLLLLALIVLVLVFDPNMFKPRIEAMAREQGVDLSINGDLGWKLWPSLGVEVNAIRVAALSAPEKPIAQLQQASLLLAIRPLFSGNVIVHHILVDGAVIDLSVDQEGTGNWEALTNTDDTPPASTPATQPSSTETATSPAGEEGSDMQLAVEKISLRNSSLTYNDAQSGQDIALQDIQLTVSKFNLQGEPFDMQLSLLTRLTSADATVAPLAVASSLQHEMQLANDFSTLGIKDGRLTLSVKGDKQTGEMSATYSLAATELQEAMRFTGELNAPSFNLKNLLAALDMPMKTAENYALTDVSFTTRFAGSLESLVFDPLTIKLDRTNIKGSVAITDFTTSALKIVLNGDQINVDHYLEPTADDKTAAASETTGDEELIPLDTVKTLNADFSADFAQVTVAEIPLKNLSVRTTAHNGVINLSKAQATAYDGLISATGQLDGRGNTAVITFNGKVDHFQLEPFLSDMELNEKVNFTGAINAASTGNTRGVTMNQLLDALVNETTLTGAQVRFFPLNIEQKFCQLVNLVNRVDDPQRAWDNFTEMKDLSGKITMAKRVVTVETFNAGIDQLMLNTQGKVDLAGDSYDFRLPLKLIPTPLTTETADDGTTVAATSTAGCIIGDNYWLNRSLSLLRCHGSLTDLNPVRDCRPDSKALASLTKDFAEHQLRQKHGARIDAVEQKVDAKKDELRKKLDEKLGGDGDGKKVEDRLKNMFRKKQDE